MTKILATLGPVSAKTDVMLDLIAAGVERLPAELLARLSLRPEAGRRVDPLDLAPVAPRDGRRHGPPGSAPAVRPPAQRRAPSCSRRARRSASRPTTSPGTAEEISTNFKKLPKTVKKGLEIPSRRRGPSSFPS